MSDQPRVRRNDWGSLTVPDLGAWEPALSVSVVIPAYDAGRLLPTVLAGLAAQSYPAHLLEVVVANEVRATWSCPRSGPSARGSSASPRAGAAPTRVIRAQLRPTATSCTGWTPTCSSSVST